MNSELHALSINAIDPDPEQPRYELESPDEVYEARTLEGLAASIRQYGVLQPIRVTALPNQRYRIVSGERRYQAAKLAGLTVIPALIIESNEVLLEQLTENIQRKAMTPLELADAVKLLVESGLNYKTIAQKLAVNPAQITLLSRLKTVSPQIKEALTDKLILSPRAAYDLNKLPDAIQHQMINHARTNQLVIVQADVQAMQKSFRQGHQQLPLYAPPVLSIRERESIADWLNHEPEDDYDPKQDLATLGIQHNNPTIDECPSPPITGADIIRIPGFSLTRDELRHLGQQIFNDTLDENTADPASWLIERIKYWARKG